MDRTIAQRLNSLLRRFRLFHLLWSWAVLALSLAGIGYLLLERARQTGSIPPSWLQIWSGAGLVALVAAWWYARRLYPNASSVAQLVERRFPNLNQRLSTAMDLRPQGASGSFTYLQRSVISEALIHDVQHRWHSIISSRRLWIAGLANVPALAALIAVGVALFRAPHSTTQPLVGSAAVSSVLPPDVQPGNTAVSKGESLIITAKFPGKVPSEVWLVSHPLVEASDSQSTDSEHRQLMKQSLSDPLFATYVDNLRQAIEYRIEYDSASSDAYTIDVYEPPEVVRMDAQLRFPLYAQMETKEVVDTRRVSAPIGTTLTWVVHLNKPIASGSLVPKTNGPTIQLQPDPENPLIAKCELAVEKNEQWAVQLLDQDGRANTVEVSLRLTALANKEPDLKLLAGGDAVVSALQEFEVSAKVKDDFGVAAVGIGYQMADGELIEQTLPLASDADGQAAKSSTVTHLIDFESLHAQPDQLLSYYLWVDDVDVDGSPRRVSSDMYFVEVRPFDEIFRQGDENAQRQQQEQQQNQQGQQSGNQQQEELLEMQKQIISASWNVARLARSTELTERSVDNVRIIADSQMSAYDLLQEQAAEAPPTAEEAVQAASDAMQRAVMQLDKAIEAKSKAALTVAITAEQQAYQSLLRLQAKENEVVRSQRSQQSQQSQSQRQQSRQQQLDQLQMEDRENQYQDQRQAQEEQQDEQSETRQIVSRLRELAMRQQDLNQQLRDVEAALQAAETEQEREELQQRLERLREQQQQILEDTDELQEKLQSSQNEQLQEAQQQLEQTRQDLQQANQSLRENDTGQALTSGARAQEQLEQMREEVRQQAANQFGESMQQMRGQAEQLQEQQQRILDQLDQPEESASTGLRETATDDSKQAAQELVQQQREQLNDLLNRMQDTIQQAEESEPLLAQKLYDGYRQAEKEEIGQQLRMTEQLMQRDLDEQAERVAGETLEDLQTLTKDIDAAAQSVLGSDLNSMRLALDQLSVARDQVDGEIARATGQASDGEREPDASQRGEAREGQPNSGEAQTGQPANAERSGDQSGERTKSDVSNDAQTGRPTPDQQRADQPNEANANQSAGNSAQSENQQPPNQPGQGSGSGEQPPSESSDAQREPSQPGNRGEQSPAVPGGQNGRPSVLDQFPTEPDTEDGPRTGGPGGGPNRNVPNASPITGDDFREWSDRLRDVEELVDDPDLRWQATNIRQAARRLRTDWQRNGTPPRWSDVEDLVATPLRELQHRVSQELIRRSAEKTEIVPVDRDPVPGQFQELVREYYERLGKGR